MMATLDVTKTNLAIERMLEKTSNPRHRFMLQAYRRHRFLQIAGRFEELFAAEMTAPRSAYPLQADQVGATLEGQDAVQTRHRHWAETNQSIFSTDNEQIAVADNYIASVTTVHQQVSGKSLTAGKAVAHLPAFISEAVVKKLLSHKGMDADENAMYVYTTTIEMIWLYDDRCRLIGEDVWEPDPDKADLVKLASNDVLTTAQAAQLLHPLIKPLPPFDEATMKPGA
jgi:hypothetical protein